MSARGVLFVHSCPPALCPHVEWAVSGVLGVPVTLSWTAQPALPGTLRAECNWRGKPGTAGQIAGAMKSWSQLRVEVTEEPSVGCDGERYALAPELGLFRTTVNVTGDLMIGEDRLRALLATATDGVALAHGLDRLLGTAWDEDLEPFRYAGEGAPVRWLHQAM